MTMADEVYATYEDDLKPLNAGSLGTPDKPVIDVKASVYVPDGLWVIFAKANVYNNSGVDQLIHLALRAIARGDGPEQTVGEDHSVVKVGPNGKADRACASFLATAYFPGKATGRVNRIVVGHWDTGAPPNIKIGRIRIVAMRTTHWVLEPSPGTHV
jgi:hypothetical protein